MDKEKFEKIKNIITVFLCGFIIIAIFAIMDCFNVDVIDSYRHAILWFYLIVYNLVFLFFVRRTKLSDDCEKK